MPGGKASRDKGARIERQIVALHQALDPPVHAQRVPLSGAVGAGARGRGVLHKGNTCDVDIYPWGADRAPLVAEVKARSSGAGFVLLERWLSDADLLFLRRDRAGFLVVLPWATWARLLETRQ